MTTREPPISELARNIHEWIYAQQTFYSRASEDSVFTAFKQKGYERITIYLAMRELYSAGYINRITYH